MGKKSHRRKEQKNKNTNNNVDNVDDDKKSNQIVLSSNNRSSIINLFMKEGTRNDDRTHFATYAYFVRTLFNHGNNDELVDLVQKFGFDFIKAYSSSFSSSSSSSSSSSHQTTTTTNNNNNNNRSKRRQQQRQNNNNNNKKVMNSKQQKSMDSLMAQLDDATSKIEAANNVIKEDGWDNMLSWLTKCRIDSRGMIKHFPYSTNALRQGTVDPIAYTYLIWSKQCDDDIFDIVDNAANISKLDSLLGSDPFFRTLLCAARLVKKGEGEELIRDKCWECNALCHTKNKCSRCGVAQYCNRQCQVNAWKGGHKDKCLDLKWVYELYKNNVKVIDAYHDTTSAAEPVAPSPTPAAAPAPALVQEEEEEESSASIIIPVNDGDEKKSFIGIHTKMADMFIAMHMMGVSIFQKDLTKTLNDMGIMGPSFDYYYENFRMVVNNEFWPYVNSDEIDKARSSSSRKNDKSLILLNNNDNNDSDDHNTCDWDKNFIQARIRKRRINYEWQETFESRPDQSDFKRVSYILCFDLQTYFKKFHVHDKDIKEKYKVFSEINIWPPSSSDDKDPKDIGVISSNDYVNLYKSLCDYCKNDTSRYYKDTTANHLKNNLHK